MPELLFNFDISVDLFIQVRRMDGDSKLSSVSPKHKTIRHIASMSFTNLG